MKGHYTTRWARPNPGEPLGYDQADFARRMDAEQGSRALLERQVRFHQYPCKIASDSIIEALGE